MSLREEFAQLAALRDSNIRELCRRFEISPTTGYKWLARYAEAGSGGLVDQSRRPHSSPSKVPVHVEEAVVALREEHAAWGPRKLRRRLELGAVSPLPARSTIAEILRRHGLLDPARPQRDLQRFERAAPNELWQIDFKGHFQTGAGTCHPLTSLDDHSRYSLGIFACENEDEGTVRGHLTRMFKRYGLPQAILCDNGSPWGSGPDCPVTRLGVWLWRLGIDIHHGRPYHPQTQGKLERFHRTLKKEVLTRPRWTGNGQCQRAFDKWRRTYNEVRPHESLGDDVPADRYRMSPRPMPKKLPGIEYDEGVLVRKVMRGGSISYKSRFYFVGRGFEGLPIGLIPKNEDGVFEVRFGWKEIGELDSRPGGKQKGYAASIWKR